MASSKKDINKCLQRSWYIRCVMVFFFVITGTGVVFAYNHPEIKWRSVTTGHFIIHFYDNTEPAVYAAWKIAEEAYEALDGLYPRVDESKINLALADYDDYGNGYADWTNGSIMVWIPDAWYDLRGNTTWIRNVIVHELAHIMSLEKKGRVQLLDWTVAMQYTSPNINIMYGEPFALTPFFPNWFIEGTAQMRAEQLGGDCWDSRRDMILRCAILNNRQLSLDAMGHFTHDIIGDEMVYNQGYSFAGYLENSIGKGKAARLWNDNRGVKVFGADMKRYFKKKYTISLDTLYQTWKDSLKNYYMANKPQQQMQVTPVWQNGKINQKPKISSDGRFWGWLTNHKDDYYRTDLVIAKYGESKPLIRIKYAKIDWDFSADGNSVYFIKSRSPDRNGSYLNDIFCYDILKKKEMRLTSSARIYAISTSSDGKELVCVKYGNNVFSLVQFSLDTKTFSTIAEGTAGEPFLTASFFPSDPRKLVVSKIAKGKAGLFAVDIAGGQLNPLINTEANEESPFCANDGRIYFSADYDGTFNIYSLLADGSDLKRHTGVEGGAFSPVLDRGGKLLIAEYTADGFRIACAATEGVSYEVPNTGVCVFEPPPTPSGKVRIKDAAYQPRLLKPLWRILTTVVCADNDNALQDRITGGEIKDSDWNIDLEVATQVRMDKTDAIGRKNMYLGAALVVQANWQPDDDSADIKDMNNDFKPCADVYSAYHAAQPGFLRREYKRKHGISYGAFERDIRYVKTLLDSEKDSDSAQKSKSEVFPLIVPFLGFENRVYKPTFGLEAEMVIFIVPQVIYLNPYIEWHVARDLYMGVSPTVTLMPLAFGIENRKPFGVSSPLWLRWFYQRYINEDMYYNYAGLSSLSLFAGPEVMPHTKIEKMDDSTGRIDTTSDYVTSLVFGVEFMHAFPIYKYSSFNIRTQTTGITMNRSIAGAVGDIDSVEYHFLLESKTRLGYTFPIIRNINRGRLYADNLYGSLFYRLDFSGTQKFFPHADKDIFVDKDYSSDYAYLSHRIGAGIELGLIKNYTFMRTLILEAAWDVFDNEVNVYLSMWF